MLIVALNFYPAPPTAVLQCCSAAVTAPSRYQEHDGVSVSSLSWHEICARYITKSYISTGSQQWTERNLKSVTISTLDGDLFCNSTIFRLIQKKVESYLIFLIHVRDNCEVVCSSLIGINDMSKQDFLKSLSHELHYSAIGKWVKLSDVKRIMIDWKLEEIFPNSF